MKHYYLLLFTFILSACHIQTQEKQPEKILNFPADCQIDLFSEMDFKFIPLETNENLILGAITQIEIDKGRFFVLDPYQNKTLYVFNPEGQFITQVGSVGQGPGEYSMPNSFVLDKKNNLILIRDLQRNQLFYYGLDDYQFKKKKDAPFYFNSFQPMENDQMAWFFTGGIDDDWYIALTDSTFKTSTHHYFKADFKSGNSLLLASNLYKLNQTLYAYHPQKPIIYRIENESLQPAYQLNIENTHFPPTEFLQKEAKRNPNYTQALATSDYIATYSFFENENALAISFLAKKTPFIGFYHKNEEIPVCYTLLDFTKMMKVDGMSQPLGCTNQYFISILSPHTLQTRYPQREELRKIKELTKEEDNPIICLYKFR